MKIVNQLSSSTPNVDVKTAPSLEAGSEFRSTLSATVAAKGTDGYDTPLIKTKSQDAKTQTPENKKKSGASDSSTSAADVPLITEKPLLSEMPIQFAIALPGSTTDASVQSSIQISNGSQYATGAAGIGGAFSSTLASIPPAQLAANEQPMGGTEQKIADGKVGLLPLSSKDPVSPTDFRPGLSSASATPSKDASALSAHIAPMSAGQAKVDPTVEASGSFTQKVASAGQGVDAPKKNDTTNPSTPVADPSVLATQQADAAIAQSTSAPVSLLDLSSISRLPQALAISTGNSLDGNKVGEIGKGAVSRPVASAAKSSPASSPSDVRSKASSSTASESSVMSDSTNSASFGAKVSEAPAMANQAASAPKNAFDAATLQQIAQVGSSDGSNHSMQTQQNVTLSAEPTIPTTPAQSIQESQATQGVSSAQLIQSMRSSEMKLGMQSAEFGNISISTSLSHQALSAQISIDHLELGRALAVHLPAIEEKLGSAYGVQARVELRDTNNPSSSNDSGYSNSGQQSREQRQSQGSGSTGAQAGMFERITPRTSFATVSPAASASRLDIRI